MRRNRWAAAAAIGVAALLLAAIAVVLAVSRHDERPGGGLPDAVAPDVTLAPTPEPEETPGTPPSTQEAGPGRVTLLGDSIMVAAEEALHEYIPGCVVNAREGRQLVEAMDILCDMEAAGEIYDTVVIGLGSNSPFPIEEGERVLDFLGEGRTVYWVTCYGRYLDWQDETNDLIWELADEYENLRVLDWSEAAPENPGWIRSDDGIHLTPDGAVGYARFVAEGIGIELPEEE